MNEWNIPMKITHICNLYTDNVVQYIWTISFLFLCIPEYHVMSKENTRRLYFFNAQVEEMKEPLFSKT